MSDDGSHDFVDLEEGGYGFQTYGLNEVLCQCGSNNFREKDGHLFCKSCGTLRDDHINAQLEYEDYTKGRALRIKKDQITDKSPNKITSMKNILGSGEGKLKREQEDNQQNRFMIFGDELLEKQAKLEQAMLDQQRKIRNSKENESYLDYIHAYEQMLTAISKNFAELYITNEANQQHFLMTVNELFKLYMDKWKSSQELGQKPISSFTIPRRGQLRQCITSRYGGLKRSFIQNFDSQQTQQDEGIIVSENLQSDLIKDNLATLVEENNSNSVKLGIIDDEKDLQERLNIQKRLYEVSKNCYYKNLKRIRKRDQKKLEDKSSGSTTAQSTKEKQASNFMLSIQNLTEPEDAEKVLEFDCDECALLTLMQRSKLFVKLAYSNSRGGNNKCLKYQDAIKNVKFKKQSNVMLNDSTLPSKGQLIKILKEQLHLDYRQFKLEGLKSIKERIILLIFIYHKIVPTTKDDAPTFKNQSELLAYLKAKYSKQVFELESQQDQKKAITVEMILREVFQGILTEESAGIIYEFESYVNQKLIEPRSKHPSHSLELNLILVFIYMAASQYGFLERDVLQAAQQNKIGYLTEYRNHLQLSKAQYLLRPINVPFKNKWLRETALDLHKIDGIPLLMPSQDSMIYKISQDLQMPGAIVELAIRIRKRLLAKSLGYFPHFEGMGCLLLSFKLLYLLNDSHCSIQTVQRVKALQDEALSEYHAIIDFSRDLPSLEHLIQIMESNLSKMHTGITPLWRIQDIQNIKDEKDLRRQLEFANKNIYDKSLKKANDIEHKDFVSKVTLISGVFSRSIAQYLKTSKITLSAKDDGSSSDGNEPYVEQQNGKQLQQNQSFQQVDDEEVKQEEEESKVQNQETEEIVPSINYIHYDYSLANYECEFYHFDFMRIIQIMQRYLNEPTCQDIIKAFRTLEKSLMNI